MKYFEKQTPDQFKYFDTPGMDSKEIETKNSLNQNHISSNINGSGPGNLSPNPTIPTISPCQSPNAMYSELDQNLQGHSEVRDT